MQASAPETILPPIVIDAPWTVAWRPLASGSIAAETDAAGRRYLTPQDPFVAGNARGDTIAMLIRAGAAGILRIVHGDAAPVDVPLFSTLSNELHEIAIDRDSVQVAFAGAHGLATATVRLADARVTASRTMPIDKGDSIDSVSRGRAECL